ncbi:hypothetical protein HanRHA438_Chr05g0209681 [Helianthus annuus]|nr:hypothetical protein HanIR_Chr05g0215831 [Helianthus annuus]KAJ0917759.1 hypothetical protein HanRHA438_Chr05g0209681 [Helianthus annuus]
MVASGVVRLLRCTGDGEVGRRRWRVVGGDEGLWWLKATTIGQWLMASEVVCGSFV